MNVKDVEDGEKGRVRALITWNRLSLFNADQETCYFLRMCVFECLVRPGPLKTWHSVYGLKGLLFQCCAEDITATYTIKKMI